MKIEPGAVCKLLLTMVLLTFAGTLGTSSGFYNQALRGAFFAFALASVVILHLHVFLAPMEILWVPAGALLLGVVDFRVLHYAPHLAACFSFLGLSSFAVMGVRGIWTKDRKAAWTVLAAWVP